MFAHVLHELVNVFVNVLVYELFTVFVIVLHALVNVIVHVLTPELLYMCLRICLCVCRMC